MTINYPISGSMERENLIEKILKIISPQIEEDCIKEGYPSNGSNYELRITAEEEWLESLNIDALKDYLARIS